MPVKPGKLCRRLLLLCFPQTTVQPVQPTVTFYANKLNNIFVKIPYHFIMELGDIHFSTAEYVQTVSLPAIQLLITK